MSLVVHDVAVEAIAVLGPLVSAVGAHDKSLADQLRRAAASILLNIAEAEGSDPGNARARFHNALGSTREVRAALCIAVAWSYLFPSEQAPVDALLDRTSAMLFRLLHPLRAGSGRTAAPKVVEVLPAESSPPPGRTARRPDGLAVKSPVAGGSKRGRW